MPNLLSGYYRASGLVRKARALLLTVWRRLSDETGGMARDERKPNSENPTMLRFNVADVEVGANLLRKRGVVVETKMFDWGVVGTFTDPDGNACELKNADDPFFDNRCKLR